MIYLNQLAMSFGKNLLFYDVNLKLSPQSRYALVGANGTGKSTLFKLINGQEQAMEGEVLIAKKHSIGWLQQDHFRYEKTKLVDIVLQGRSDLWKLLVREKQLNSSEEWNDQKGLEFAEVLEKIGELGGYEAESFAKRILSGLGIKDDYHSKPLSDLSGGYKLRVLLAKVLFQQPSILLLDEPTNHLDIESIRWLESFLKNNFKGTLVFITHDEDFINNTATHILDLDFGEIRIYHQNNYQAFLKEKALLEEQKRVEVKAIENRIKTLQAFVDKNRAKASKAKQAQSRVKLIEKLSIPDVKKSSRVAGVFNFKLTEPSSNQILSVANISKAYGSKSLFKNLSFLVTRGEKIAIMGVNGAGKSTLIKILLAKTSLDHGIVRWGSNLQLEYFSQDHHEDINQSMSMLDWLGERVSEGEQAIRKCLAQLLFVKDDVDKDVLTLSGGECARLLLAKVMLSKPNVLVLDEPTNHMDLETIEALSLALASFQGTLFIVSHNRYIVNKVAKRVLYFTGDGDVIDHLGDYQSIAMKFNLK